MNSQASTLTCPYCPFAEYEFGDGQGRLIMATHMRDIHDIPMIETPTPGTATKHEALDEQLNLAERIARSLTNHKPDDDQVARIEHLRRLAKQLGATIAIGQKISREQSLALTNLEQCVMWAVKGILMNDTPPQPDGMPQR